jgi:uncharacterized protein
MSDEKYTNALVHETSPYLLQHSHNPVSWYPWAETALQRARQEDKPILLSIGYSACHWCHVMEHESFENEAIARIMNENFINIKVDREERPDLDAIYMNAVQMMTGSGGWPMTVFLTPDQVPFYGGTYYPPEDRHGMPGFPRVLLSVAQAYRERKSEITRDAGTILSELQKGGRLPASETELSIELLDAAARSLLANYDSQHGGFGRAPKFPPSMTLTFLLRSHRRSGDRRYLDAVELTLEKMASGGIYDQLGGGFHRYSVDQYWLVPHFEKMLYDNALLSRIYLDAYLATGNDLYRRITEETLDYVVREMVSPEGGFYSTQDADSEGHEGKFFVWTPKEVEEILGEKDSDIFCRYFDITPEGNFEGKNILHVPRDGRTVAKLNRVDEEEFWGIIKRGKKHLFEVREIRVKPGRDEKILTAWNALMLRSFAEAANGLDRDDYRSVAVSNAEFILSKLERNGRLLRTYKDGKAKLPAYLEDYAYLIDAFLSLYEATFELRWIKEAQRLSEILVKQFWDSDASGFFFTAADHESLISRPKDFYDNATPAGNSVAAHALLRLGKLTGDESWAGYAESLLRMLAGSMSRYPSAFGNFLCALDFCLSRPKEIAIIGDPLEQTTRSLLRKVFGRYLPNKVVACSPSDGLFLLKNRSQIDSKPTAYVCENYACRAPVNTPEELESVLEE